MARRRKSLARIVPGTSTWTYELEDRQKAGRFDRWINPLERFVVDPPEQTRLPEDGAWVLVIRELPPLQEGVDGKVRPGTVFWATRQPGCDAFGFSRHGTYKALARTPWGAVGLWPYEYSMVDPAKVLAFWDRKELVFHPTDGREHPVHRRALLPKVARDRPRGRHGDGPRYDEGAGGVVRAGSRARGSVRRARAARDRRRLAPAARTKGRAARLMV